ncbi:MFS transporter [Agaricicola taiwanensis]|uniref:MFS transporter n=1 Tax=Agaricicola taiwanensis TaxID=591372 RepID=A0A8J2VLT4_9RHOB|nr:tripartite tricarboxylate transporter substrate binding protein [Agaricicola taiwanensis]GGE30860.1 MFS transporter [Agaricicola taiwanensis]
MSGPEIHNTEQNLDREVRLIVPIEAGGIIDMIATPLAGELRRSLGGQVRVEYVPGALTQTGSALAAASPGDGFTLLAHSRQLITNVYTTTNAVQPLTDLKPLSMVATTPFVLAVNPSLPIYSISDLVDAASKARLSYANSGRASNQQMAMELFKDMSGLAFVRREYDGGGGAQDAVVSGESDIGIFAQVAIMRHIEQSKLRAIAVTGAERSAALPDIPTVAESGFGKYQFISWVGLFAPGSTPPGTVARLSNSLTSTIRAPAFSSLMRQQGAKAIGSTSCEFASFIAEELSQWKDIIGRSGV